MIISTFTSNGCALWLWIAYLWLHVCGAHVACMSDRQVGNVHGPVSRFPPQFLKDTSSSESYRFFTTV